MAVNGLKLCKHKDCIKKDQCYRYDNNNECDVESQIDFKQICNEENEYQWFGQKDVSIESIEKKENIKEE